MIMARTKLLLMVVLGLLLMPQASAAQGEVCLVYFTSTSCPNCAITDPIVLEQWTGENSNKRTMT